MRSKRWMRIGFAAACLAAIPLSTSARLETQQQGSVTYVSGGVGDAEAQAIKDMSSDYSLQLLFVTRQSGQYLADVKVRITDSRNNVMLDTTSEGPYLLAKLPAGRYTVTAELNGQVQRQTVQVNGSRGQRLVLGWDDKTAYQ